MSSKKQGFASFSPEKHKEVSSRGGKAKVPKGTAKLTTQQRKERGSIAGKARWAKARAERSRGATINT